jgi:hypothetical protein
MEHVAVASVAIALIGYDKEARELEVIPWGQTYIYKGVPLKVWNAFARETGSKGQYYNQYIKNHYEFEEKSKIA